MILANIRASAWKWGAIAATVLAVAALVAAVMFRSAGALSDARREAAEKTATELAGQLAQARGVIAIERQKAADLSLIADQYEQDKTDAQSAGKAVAADLLADNRRLRNHWQGCIATGEVAAAAGQPDEGARLRAESAGRIIAAADEADAQIRGLQRVIEADRK